MDTLGRRRFRVRHPVHRAGRAEKIPAGDQHRIRKTRQTAAEILSRNQGAVPVLLSCRKKYRRGSRENGGADLPDRRIPDTGGGGAYIFTVNSMIFIMNNKQQKGRKQNGNGQIAEKPSTSKRTKGELNHEKTTGHIIHFIFEA